MSLNHAILSMLTREPKTGYDIAKEFTGSIKNYWSASHQQIYKTLAKVEEKKWVSHTRIIQDTKPAKKEYVITDAGTEELKRWVNLPQKMEGYKSTLSIKIIAMDAAGIAPVLMELNEYKNHMEQQRAHLESIRDKRYPGKPEELEFSSDYEMGRYVVFRRGMCWAKQELEWLNDMIPFLEDRLNRVSTN